MGKVLDFGCGSCGPTYLLKFNGADVVGVDETDWRGISDISFLAQEKIVVGDGFEYMKKLEENSLDMITAFMFGPAMDDSLVHRFYAAAQRVINPEGRILVCSDAGTMGIVNRLYGSRGIRLYSQPSGLVLSKSEIVQPIVLETTKRFPVKDYVQPIVLGPTEGFLVKDYPALFRGSEFPLDLSRFIK